MYFSFGNSHDNTCELMFHCDFDCISLVITDVEHLFIHLRFLSFWRNACVCVLLTQSCSIFCDPKDCSPPNSLVHGILQAKILEWATMTFSKGSSQPRDQTQVLCFSAAALLSELPWKPIQLLSPFLINYFFLLSFINFLYIVDINLLLRV